MLTLMNPLEEHIDFKIVVSIIVVASTLTIIQMLQRTK